MITNVTSLTGNGLRDWLIQRITAVYFAFYSIFMLSYFANHIPLHYYDWQDLVHNKMFIIASVLALLAFSLHAWIGIWTVTTDYIKSTAIRLAVQMLILLCLLWQFIWCFVI